MSDTRDPTPLNAKWHGKKLYQCRLCAFTSLDRQTFEQHFARTHPPLQIIAGGKEPDDPAVKEEPNEPTNGQEE